MSREAVLFRIDFSPMCRYYFTMEQLRELIGLHV